MNSRDAVRDVAVKMKKPETPAETSWRKSMPQRSRREDGETILNAPINPCLPTDTASELRNKTFFISHLQKKRRAKILLYS